jgi:lipoate-protein ligase A
MLPLHVFSDPPLDGPSNMARDEHLLHAERVHPAALRLYAWDPPTISLGYFQHFAAVAELPGAVRDLAVVRRVTGGGAILHDREITYCLVLDTSVPVAAQAPLALYELVHRCWREVLVADGWPIELAPEHWPLPTPRSGPFFCFEKPGRTDLVLGPRKVLGSAQRRLPGRVLQHGSLLLGQRFAAHPGADLGGPADEVVARWRAAFVAQVAAALALDPRPAAWQPEQLADVEQRRRVHADPAWVQRR